MAYFEINNTVGSGAIATTGGAYTYDYWLDVVDESPLKTPTSNKLKLETIIEKYNSSSGSYKSFLF